VQKAANEAKKFPKNKSLAFCYGASTDVPSEEDLDFPAGALSDPPYRTVQLQPDP
jgi:hypothetical protein